MKFGMNVFLWKTHVTSEHEGTLNTIKVIAFHEVRMELAHPSLDREPPLCI